MPCLRRIRRGLCTLLVLASGSAGLARASATLLLEEPYGKLGFFTATGHAAVYLSGVCAQTPLVLRPCAPGELGAVISRYDGVGGYDWVAIPLIPYLYAVDQPDNIPLFVDPKMVSFLRDLYRRRHLEAVAPDREGGETPSGNWYELVGSAYDRTVYAFEIETTPAQDQAFIEKYNSSPNRSHFRTVSSNCADFAKDVINFYYPRALHRSIVADVGMTTPKQMAKTLIRYSAHHPRLQFSRFVIPQIPGSIARSTPVHGVVESFLKSKKYMVPSAVASPIFAGCVVAVYVGTGAGRFDPSRQALVFNAQRELEPPLGTEDRLSYQNESNHLLENQLAVDRPRKAAAPASKNGGNCCTMPSPSWMRRDVPVMRIPMGDAVVSVGISSSNFLASDAPVPFTEQLLEARLHAELRRGSPPKVSESDVSRDWNLLQRTVLQKSMNGSDAQGEARSRKAQQVSSQSRPERSGNQP